MKDVHTVIPLCFKSFSFNLFVSTFHSFFNVVWKFCESIQQTLQSDMLHLVITIRYMINSCDTWSTGFHGNDQCLSYMINSLSYQWSTVVINDQQSFMAMINVYLTWSTVFHPMIDVDHAWTVMNDIVHKAMNNANCIYTLTFTFLLSSSPTSGERRGGDGC